MSTTTSKPTARDLHAAMVALRTGTITPDEYRAIMRRSRDANGATGHDLAKFAAAANLSAR